MPAHQRVWLEDDGRIEQGREQPVEPNEDQPVRAPQPEPRRCRPPQNQQLLPQKKNRCITRGAGAAHAREQRTNESENAKHPCTSLIDRQTRASPDEIFYNDRWLCQANTVSAHTALECNV